jgi:hypothetical protein
MEQEDLTSSESFNVSQTQTTSTHPTDTFAEDPPSDEKYSSDDDSDSSSNGRNMGIVLGVRKAKTKAEREAAKGQKAGNQGRFHGAQLEYLQEFIEAYKQIEKGQRGNNPKLEVFWHTVRSGFWERFSWKDVRQGMKQEYRKWPENAVRKVTNAVNTYNLHRC